MNDDTSTPLTFLVDPESLSKQVKSEIRANKDLIQHTQATNKAKLVALIELEWYRDLIFWASSTDIEMPGPIPNHKLCTDGKLESSKKLGQDFTVISLEGWELLVKKFKGGPKILRNYVLNPKNNKPCILTNPVQIEIIFNGKAYKKHVDDSWTVGPIKRLLCKTLEIEPGDYVFLDSTNTTEIDKDSKVADILRSSPGAWNLVLTEEAQNKPPAVITIDGRQPASFHKLQCDSIYSFLTMPLFSLFSLEKFKNLMFNPDLPSIINKNNPNSSGGRATAVVRKMIREINKKNEEPLSTEIYNKFMCRRFPNFQSDDNHNVSASISAILDSLHQDMLSEDQSSPISKLFLIDVHGTKECDVCHNFTDVNESVDSLFLPIPHAEKALDVRLEDCIARYSMPETLPVSEYKKCSKCGKQGPFMLYKSVRNISDVLILNLNRFTANSLFETKNNTFVTFPFELKSAAFASQSDAIYHLKSVIYHKGDIDSHIYEVAFKVDDKWLYMTTSGVIEVNKDELVNPEALVLFYEKD